MKYLIIFLAVMMLASSALAQPLTANAYQKSVFVNSTNTEEAIVFPIPVRNLLIVNGDSSDACWIDIESSTRTAAEINPVGIDTEGYFLLPAGDILEFYNYMCDGISVVYYAAEASPVTVIATY